MHRGKNEQNRGLIRVIDEYYERIFKYAFVLTGSFEDAQDLTQETFATAVDKTDILETHSHQYAWLRTVLYHHYQHWLRKRSKEAVFRANLGTKSDNGENDAIQKIADKKEDVADMLIDMDMQRILSKEEYDLLRKVYFEDETIANAASEMGITAVAGRKKIQRIREKLRNYP